MSGFPPLLTEAAARLAVNLPPPAGTPDQYTDRVALWIDAITDLANQGYDGLDADGLPRWASTDDLPARVTAAALKVFRREWSEEVGAHSPQFGPGRFEPDTPNLPAYVFEYVADQYMADLKLRAFA